MPTIIDMPTNDLDNRVSSIYNEMLTLLVKSIVEPVVISYYQVNSCQKSYISHLFEYSSQCLYRLYHDQRTQIYETWQ